MRTKDRKEAKMIKFQTGGDGRGRKERREKASRGGDG